MSEYEFTERQNTIFDQLSISLRQFGIQLGVFAVMLLFLGLVFAIRGNVDVTDRFGAIAGGAGIMVIGALSLALCFRMLKPVDEFHKIVTTKDRDISQLMMGLEKLNWANGLLRIILILLLIGAVVGAYRFFT